MTDEQRCGTCRFWSTNQPPVGTCRRYPPTLVGNIDGGADHWLPSTLDTEWCGEWQAKADAEPDDAVYGGPVGKKDLPRLPDTGTKLAAEQPRDRAAEAGGERCPYGVSTMPGLISPCLLPKGHAGPCRPLSRQ